MRKLIFVLPFAIFFIVLAACRPAVISPNVAPNVVDWKPGAVDDVALNTSIELRFDQPMDMDSIAAALHMTPTMPLKMTVFVKNSVATAVTTALNSPRARASAITSR